MRYTSIFAGLFVLLLSSCAKLEEPVFNHIDNLKAGTLGLKSSLMTFDMHYYNPNNRKARLKSAEGEAWMDSSYIGHFHIDTIVDIPAKANFILPVKLDVDMKYLLNYSLFGFRNEEVVVRVKGKARVGKGRFYKNIPVDYEGRQNLKELFK